MAKEKDQRLVRFGQRLRELREQKWLSRAQLKDLTGLSERAIIQWEIGVREPGWFNVLALCVALDVSCEAFKIEPQPAPPAGRGRPPKSSPAPEDKPASKTKKGKK